uniref:Uncharacterized protein n=1 Tax=Ciona intestinalis TaxID=7719 RepID=F7AH44_CIOIN
MSRAMQHTKQSVKVYTKRNFQTFILFANNNIILTFQYFVQSADVY